MCLLDCGGQQGLCWVALVSGVLWELSLVRSFFFHKLYQQGSSHLTLLSSASCISLTEGLTPHSTGQDTGHIKPPCRCARPGEVRGVEKNRAL